MKTAVYAIALNEERFVERWFMSAKEADFLIIGDTGSTDQTKALAESLGIKVIDSTVSPWRFDAARNIVLSAIPEDIEWCIALDLDEVILPNWKSGLEEADARGINLPEYRFVHDWLENGTEGLVYSARKIHTRHGFNWRLPIHEALYPLTGVVQKTEYVSGIEIHHHQDLSSKPHREHPIEMLQLALEEDPDSTTVLFYLSRAQYQRGEWGEAKAGFIRILELLRRSELTPQRKNIAAEKVMRYLAHMDESNRRQWLLAACACCPDKREPWAVIAEFYFFNEEYDACLAAAERAFSITKHKFDHEPEPFAWGHKIYEFAALSAYNLGITEKGDYYANITREMFAEESKNGTLC